MNNNDTFKLGKYEFTSRFILGSGKYSLELIDAAVKQAEAQIVTLALRRANDGGIANILDYIPENVKLLPDLLQLQPAHRPELLLEAELPEFLSRLRLTSYRLFVPCQCEAY